MTRQHPVAILRYVSKKFWLFLIPFIRGLTYLKYNFYGWLEGAYIDIAVLAFLFGSAVFKWYNVKFDIEKHGIKIKEGFFYKCEWYIPYKAFTTLNTGKYLIMRLFGAVYMSVDSKSFYAHFKPSEPDMKIIISLIEYQKIYKHIPDIRFSKNAGYVLSNKRTLFFSLVFSSFLSGALYFAVFFIQGGKLLYEEVEKRFVSAVNDITEIAEKIINGITPFTIAAAIIIAASWLLSFISNYLKYVNFSVGRYKNTLFIGNGFFSERNYFINTEEINFIDLKQNLPMKLFGCVTVNIDCPGYESRKNKIPVFIPITKISNVSETVKKFLPEFYVSKAEMFPGLRSFFKYIISPLILIFGIIVLALTMIMIFPDWYRVIFYCSVMGEILSLYFFTAKITAFFTSGAGYDGKLLTMKYRKIFHFHYIMIPYDKAVKIKIRQSIFQRKRSACDFIVYTKNKRVQRHIVNELDINDAVRLAKCLGCTYCNF